MGKEPFFQWMGVKACQPGGGRAPLRDHFEGPKWTKSHLGALPLRTPLGSAALWLWKNPNRPRDKLILITATSAAAQRPNVDSTCPRRTGPVKGGGCQSAPDPDAFAKEAPRFYTGSISGSGARRADNPPHLSVGVGCSSAVHGDLSGGYLGGNALGDSFPDFLSLRNRAQRSVPPGKW